MANEPAPARGDAKFGDGQTFDSDVGLALAVSPDKKTFTASFGRFETVIGPTAQAPIVSRSFSFSVPLSGAAPGTEIPFFVQGFILCEKGADGHLIMVINDQTTVVDFPEGSDTSFLHTAKFKVGSASEVRITIFTLLDRDSTSTAQASLTVDTIDTDATKQRR
jgi:hypothetical protein